jgi:uncharacterized protein YjbI with pentapeptide repeats
MIGRRAFFGASLGAALGDPRSLTAGHRVRRRVSQTELNDAIDQHARWLEDRARGRRASFACCDLSGLDFGATEPDQVLLRGADFTEADLRGIRGNDLNFHHASLHYANLSHSHLKAPVFGGAILRNADCRDIVWGWPTRETPRPASKVAASEMAVFMSTCLAGANFDQARVRGYFHDCSLNDASLVLADFSQSEFAGTEESNRFRGARLIRTNLQFASIDSARLDKALIREADFLGARLHPRIAAHLLGRDARNVGA